MARFLVIIAMFAAVIGAPAWGTTKMSAYDFSFTHIDGGAMPLQAYHGKVLLVVNTASFCGFTPQYTALEQLYQRYRDRGLVVIGVPANDFGAQEPGTNGEIKKFCESKFDIDFPMTGKEMVVGPDAHPFYRWIAAELGEGALPKWNFHKYLIGRDGAIAGVFPSSVKPDSAELTEAVEHALAQ